MKIIKIGRSSSNDVVIDDSMVSKTHCQIIKDDNGNFYLIDTNSLNGTYVNGVRRQGEIRLNNSDIVRIGNSTLPWQTYFNNTRTEIGEKTRISDECRYYPPTPSPTKPNSFLVWAILCTIFCCLPFGIVSIVQASKVDSRWYAGDYEGAEDAANKARTWFWWGFGIGLIGTLFSIIYYIVVGFAIGFSGL